MQIGEMWFETNQQINQQQFYKYNLLDSAAKCFFPSYCGFHVLPFPMGKVVKIYQNLNCMSI